MEVDSDVLLGLRCDFVTLKVRRNVGFMFAFFQPTKKTVIAKSTTESLVRHWKNVIVVEVEHSFVVLGGCGLYQTGTKVVL